MVTIVRPGYARCDDKGLYHADGTVTLIRVYTSSSSSSSDFTVLVDTGSPRSGGALVSALSAINVSVNDIDVVIGTHGHVDHIGNLNLFADNDKTIFYLGTDVLKPKDVYDSIHFLPVEVDAMLDDGGESKIRFNNASVFTSERLENVENSFLLLSTPGHTASDLSFAVVSDEVVMTCLECEKKRSSNLESELTLPPVELCFACQGLNSKAGTRPEGRKEVVVVAGDLFEDENDDNDDGAAWKENSWDAKIQEKSRLEILGKANVIVPGHGRPFRNKWKNAAGDRIKEAEQKH